FKRMAGIDRGQKSPLGMDMYDFLIGMLVLPLIFFWSWWINIFTIWHILWLMIFTPLVHRGSNIIGYLIGIKQVPW
ncbi:MAG: CDP-archaeol synthase, partial [Thermoplasmata archaeon]